MRYEREIIDAAMNRRIELEDSICYGCTECGRCCREIHIMLNAYDLYRLAKHFYHVLHRLLMPRHSPCALISLTQQKNPLDLNLVSLVELCRLNNRSYFLAKIVFITLLIKSFPLLLPSHNCINNFNVQFSRCIFESLKRLNEASYL